MDSSLNHAPTISIYADGARKQGTSTHEIDFALLDTFVDMFELEQDPFSDDGMQSKFPFEIEATREVRGQLIRSAAAVWGMQYRTHLYSVAIFGEYARLFRWDASGAIVTGRFNYFDTPFLVDFLLGFASFTDEERGRDATVTPVASPWPTDIAPATALERLRDADYDGPMGTLRHRHFCIMKVPDRTHPTKEVDFLISSPPKYKQRAPVGRCTRPMLAYDTALSRVVFVKQYWRPIWVSKPSEPTIKEGDVYAQLNEQEISHLPVFGRGNDVRSLKTITRDIRAGKPWGHRTHPIPILHLYRMSLETIAEPLSSFRNTKELTCIVRDAMQCHDDAYFKAKILHRDISARNIVIDSKTRQGLLIDWDLAAPVDDGPSSTPSVRDCRIGTWEYMSARLLQEPNAPHTVVDDRESALYVLIWMVLLYTRHNAHRAVEGRLRMFREMNFINESEPPVGGIGKTAFLAFSSFHKEVILEEGQKLPDFIVKLSRTFSCRYTSTEKPDDSDDEIIVFKAYDRRRALLAQRGTFVKLLDAALEDPTWVANDSTAFKYITPCGKEMPLRKRRPPFPCYPVEGA